MNSESDLYSILLIEDDEDSIQLTETLIEFSDLSVALTVVKSLEEAKEKIAKNEYDLILTDLRLPDSDNLDTLRSVTQAAFKTPVIVLTATQDQSLGVEAIKEGADDYLVKDETYAKLLARSISYAIERKKLKIERSLINLKLSRRERLNILGELSAGIAHNFNNILQPILGLSVRLAKEKIKKGEINSDEEIIMLASKKAKELVAQILAFARERPLQQEFLDASSFANQTLNLVRLTKPSSIILEEHLGNKLGQIKVDPTQMGIALLSIITNSIDAIENKIGTITILVEREIPGEISGIIQQYLKNQECIVISISDTGTGINAKILTQVFEPFFTTKEPDAGTGLGLSTTYGIVKNHGGDILIESIPGEGTTVKIFLPRHEGKSLH